MDKSIPQKHFCNHTNWYPRKKLTRKLTPHNKQTEKQTIKSEWNEYESWMWMNGAHRASTRVFLPANILGYFNKGDIFNLGLGYGHKSCRSGVRASFESFSAVRPRGATSVRHVLDHPPRARHTPAPRAARLSCRDKGAPVMWLNSTIDENF